MAGHYRERSKLSRWCRGELSMPVPWPELASWIEARLGVNAGGGAAIPARDAACRSGVPAAGKVFIDSAARFGVMLLLPARCSNRPFIPRAKQGCIFMPLHPHATNGGGIRALSEWLNENTALDGLLISPNPA